MGVPVLTLAGPVHAARVGNSILHAAGLDRLVATDAAGFSAAADALLADRDGLADLRRSLRGRLRQSSLCDETGFTRRLEQAYRDMWRRVQSDPS